MLAELINYLSGFVSKERLEKFEQVLGYRTRYINLVCEDIYQGHNASALVRTCDCFGIQDVHIIEKRNLFEINTEVALGASNWLTITHHGPDKGNIPAIFDGLRSKGYRIVATTPHEKGVKLSEFDPGKGPFSLVFGTEKEGLSGEILENADEFIHIEMYGFTESFNVSVSAGIILHQLRMKLQNSGINWQLDENEKNRIMLEWLRQSIRRCDLIEKRYKRRVSGQGGCK